MKVGVYDSGIGGLTVLKQLKARYPSHEYLYFGDNANVPYGSKLPAEIQTLAVGAAQRFLSAKVDILVVACNTVSCVALEAMRKVMHPIPIYGIVDAGVKSVMNALDGGSAGRNILVLGTEATIRSHVFRSLLQPASDGMRVFERACPRLAPLIEKLIENQPEHPMAIRDAVVEALQPFQDLNPGVALLACTHYPWIIDEFTKVFPDWVFVEPAKALADSLKPILGRNETASNEPSVKYEFSAPDFKLPNTFFV